MPIDTATLRHANGNLIAAIDVETTGTDPMVHEILQICILPLDSFFRPIKVAPFYMSIKPMDLGNVDWRSVGMNKKIAMDLLTYAIEPSAAALLLEDWFYRLDLPLDKKLMPLWSNGAFDRSFIQQWLGVEQYNAIFHYHERDTQSLALWINDRYDRRCEPLPFGKIGLNSLAATFGIVNENPHDALSDCLTTAAVWEKTLSMEIP